MKKFFIVLVFILAFTIAGFALFFNMDKDLSEKQIISKMQETLMQKMQKDYKKGDTRRDAHPKTLGLLKADFRVLDDISQDFKAGIFKQAKTYKAFIRISNASGSIKSDKEKDFRGFTIKLLGVDGERFDKSELGTQDFLLMSHETMPLGTVKLFYQAVDYAINYNPLMLVGKFVFTGNKKILDELKNGVYNDTSPLDIKYWSTTPYALGNEKVKYKIVPTSNYKSTLPKVLSDDYLTQNMAKHLQNEKASYDFYVQKFENGKTTPIEDASIKWKSKFIKVATITIPKQNILSPKRFNIAEDLSFSPAHALKENRPLGGLNEARIAIYKTISDFRHKRDDKKIFEPNLVDFENIK